MHWLLDFVVVWLGMSILIIATGWYATVLIKPRYPIWWRRVVVDVEPDSRIIRRQLRR